EGAGGGGNGLHGVGVVAGVKLAKFVAVEEGEFAFLPSGDQQVWGRARLIGKQDGAARGKNVVGPVGGGLVWRGDVGGELQIGSEFEDGVAVVAPLVVPGEIPVTSHREDVAVLVRRKASIALPDRRLSSIGRGVEGALLPKRVGVVRHQPAVIRTNVAGRAPREIDRVFGQKERGAGI